MSYSTENLNAVLQKIEHSFCMLFVEASAGPDFKSHAKIIETAAIDLCAKAICSRIGPPWMREGMNIEGEIQASLDKISLNAIEFMAYADNETS